MDDEDPVSLSYCIATQFARHLADAKLARSRAASGIDLLSVPALRFAFCSILQHKPFQIGGDAAVLCFCLLANPLFELGGNADCDAVLLVAMHWKSPVAK